MPCPCVTISIQKRIFTERFMLLAGRTGVRIDVLVNAASQWDRYPAPNHIT
jgi:hypothetical protein